MVPLAAIRPVGQQLARRNGEEGHCTSDDGTGIRGGIGGGEGYQSDAVFYVGVPDVEAALQRAESLGGTRVMGPAVSPRGLVVGHFTDPEGTPDRRRRSRVILLYRHPSLRLADGAWTSHAGM